VILKTSNDQENENDDDDGHMPVMDDEFEEYLEKATIKCADWLMKHFFDHNNNNNNDNDRRSL